jgi:AbrB family looped-hinge helix DNA binding protein
MRSFEVKVNAKGQITIPAPLRRLWNLKRGEKVEFYLDRMNTLIVRPRNLPPSTVFENAPKKRSSYKQMTDDEAIAAAVIEKDRRSRSRSRSSK